MCGVDLSGSIVFVQMMEDANLVNLVNGRHTPISGMMC